MPVEIGHQNGLPDVPRRSTLDPGMDTAGQGTTSPMRLLLVIVPTIVFLAALTNLLGVWSFSAQQALREQQAAAPPLPEAEQLPPPEPRSPSASGPEISRPAPQMPAAPHSPSAPPAAVKPSVEGPARSAEGPAPSTFDAAAVVARVATADAEKGAVTFRICSICHNAEEGAGNKIGPNLWGVVGRDIAAEPDFRYSQGLRAKAAGFWSLEELAAFLHAPRQHTPGTSMAFRGIEDPAKLADVLAHMRRLAENPPTVPR